MSNLLRNPWKRNFLGKNEGKKKIKILMIKYIQV